MNLQICLRMAVEKNASDIFIGARRRISFKENGHIVTQINEPISKETAEEMVRGLYGMANRPINKVMESGDDDFPVTLPGVSRFRVSTFLQRGTMAAVIRVVKFDIPDYMQIGIPEDVIQVASEKQGLVLVTGPAGSGKTTTLACVIDSVNKNRNCHIITLEDPIEYLHKDDKSLISQREIAIDTESYITALRSCLRQAPDIILLGEMRDYETIKTAMTAAETGHLIISTLHTVGAVNTLDRIVDVFPPGQQPQIRIQLAMLLKTVITQQLLPGVNSGRLVPAFEIMHTNNAIRTLIRESKTHQIDNVIKTSANEGMISMDSYILNLYKEGKITADVAICYAINTDLMHRHIGNSK